MNLPVIVFAIAVVQHGFSSTAALSRYVRAFNEGDEELYTNAIPNAVAEEFMLENCPRFACPDNDIERTYYFRWWTYRKHLRHDLGFWTVTEFLPKVAWSGKDNTIVCPAGHHFQEGRWLRNPTYMTDLAKFWLADSGAVHRWDYSSWLFTGICRFAEIAACDELPVELLDAAIAYYRGWEQGLRHRNTMGGDGKGGFLSNDDREGTEISLGGNGYKPLFACAMWSEAMKIAEVADRAGRSGIAAEFRQKAETNRRSVMEHCWNPNLGFFTTARRSGEKGTVRELHGFAPWYFGMPTDGRAPDWKQLMDAEGFAGKCGLSFPERRAKGFTIDYAGHECKWNGPSWPFATSIALTAYVNDIHASHASQDFLHLLHQYAFQHQLDGRPWIDENCHPDRIEWISRKIIIETPTMLVKFPKERGKDYNHSTFCDLVISGLVGFVPDGDQGFVVDPLFPADWDYCVLEKLRYRGHDVDIRWNRGAEEFSVWVDGVKRINVKRPERVSVRLMKTLYGTDSRRQDGLRSSFP